MFANNKLLTNLLIPLLFVFLWSTGFIGAKYGLPSAEPFTFLSVRMAITVAVLIAIIPFIKIKWPRQPMAYLHMAIVGILIHGVYLGGVFSAIHRGLDSGLSAVIVGLQPLLTVILSAVWLREKMSAIKMLGMVLGFAGIVIVIGERGIGTDGISPMALWFCIGSLIGISIGTIYQKKFCTGFELLPSAFTQYSANVVFLFALALLFETREIEWNLQFSFALAWLVFALSLGAVFLLMWLIRTGEAGKVASLFYLVPPLVTIEAWILFDEVLSVFAIIGIALCVIGVALVINAPSHQNQQR